MGMVLSVLISCVSLCVRIPQFLFRWCASFQLTLRKEMDEYQVIAQVVASLAAHMEIQTVRISVDMLSHIACHHRRMETYREHQLCADATERTFLIDLQKYYFVKATATHLVLIRGVSHAKTFVDQICLLRHQQEVG